MSLDRRQLLVRTGIALGLGAGVVGGGVMARERRSGSDEPANAPVESGPAVDDWQAVRDQFALSRDFLHFGGLYIASHPAPVQQAIEAHRRGMDENPVFYLQDNGGRLEANVLRAAAAYLNAGATDIALTDSTTMGLGLLYNGLDLDDGDEALTTHHDFFATHEALRLKASRSGAVVRTVPLYQDIAQVTEDEIVTSLIRSVTPRTRVVAVTYVHSSTGLKLPIRRIADEMARLNADREEPDRALLCVDGVHGLGVEDFTMASLGCDFFVAGCHKWLFGPRGTGLVWGKPSAWERMSPTIPSFSGGDAPGAVATPGGFHSFEHRWALAEAFHFHQQVGRPRITQRIHALNRQLKEELATMPHVSLYTPLDENLSAGLVCFDVDDLSPRAVVQRLRDQQIVATTTPYTPAYARLAAGLLNSREEVDQVLREVRALA
ncbi:MAG: aminotransferase class V-fold PLP-dependent enzyme [Dehalococcoidia bacterium]